MRYRLLTDADYTDDIALLANTPSHAESRLHIPKQAEGGIVPYANADKMEYMCYNKKAHISTLNGGSLKLVDKFAYLGSSVLSTENDINMRQAKAGTAIYRLSIIWKSNLSDQIKRMFSQKCLCRFY